MKKIFRIFCSVPKKLKKLNIRQRLKTLVKNNAERVTYQEDKVIYEIELIHQTVNFMESTIKKTYRIVKKFTKSGIVKKITLGIATVVIVLSLTFGSGPAEAVEPMNPTPPPIERAAGKGKIHPGNPGIRARSDVRNRYRKPGSSNGFAYGFNIVPQNQYSQYHDNKALSCNAPKRQVPGAEIPTRTTTPVSPNRQQRMNSEPLSIKSEHQQADVVITQKDIRKWTTPRERSETPNQKFNEHRFGKKLVNTVKNPDEVLDGTHIHRKQQDCKIYVKNQQIDADTSERLAVIVDSKSGRASLGSLLSEQEYFNLKETGNLDLSDLRRDPQTLVMNEKAIREAEILGRAKDEGCFAKLSKIRRPYNQTESNGDFVGTDSTNSMVEIEIKGLIESKIRPYHVQTRDINQGIKHELRNADDPNKVQIICDLSPAPQAIQKTLFKEVTEGLTSDEVSKIDFLYNN